MIELTIEEINALVEAQKRIISEQIEARVMAEAKIPPLQQAIQQLSKSLEDSKQQILSNAARERDMLTIQEERRQLENILEGTDVLKKVRQLKLKNQEFQDQLAELQHKLAIEEQRSVQDVNPELTLKIQEQNERIAMLEAELASSYRSASARKSRKS